MSVSRPNPELLREVATALRWAAHGGAEHVERLTPDVRAAAPPRPGPADPSGPSNAPDTARGANAPHPARGGLRLRDRPRLSAKVVPHAPGDLAAIRARMGDCQRCPLHSNRKQIVFGSGANPARLMIIGDGPGEQEDAAGALWQGEVGALLDRMLAAIGLSRAEVYLSSMVMCRLPDESPPPAEALKACTPFLRSQLVALQPEAVLVLGESAARFLTRKDAPISELRGHWWPLVERPAIASHSLDKVLATPALKRESWSDLQQVMARLGLSPR